MNFVTKYVICECCYVVHGWVRYCNCSAPTRTDPENPFGLSEPYINTTMGRNEKSGYVTPEVEKLEE